MIVGIVVYILLFMICWALATAGRPITEEERKYEDEAQMEYLKEWRMRQSR